MKEQILPIKWLEWDKIDELFHQYYDVEFLESFGIIPKGIYKCVSIDYGSGKIEVYNEDGTSVIYTQLFKANPII